MTTQNLRLSHCRDGTIFYCLFFALQVCRSRSKSNSGIPSLQQFKYPPLSLCFYVVCDVEDVDGHILSVCNNQAQVWENGNTSWQDFMNKISFAQYSCISLLSALFYFLFFPPFFSSFFIFVITI
uniref:Uncharacterized protein n=1 Tax=Physcomitrium patens TaxID=3218 RepID=A0A2K1J4G1_PHYPA|nr:hypothetical protein PHYPA_022263 [Physcomitrium patens]